MSPAPHAPHWTPRLHGRTAECGRLGELLGPFGAGSSLRVLIEGEPGIGRTQLVDWVAAHARARGLQTLVVGVSGIAGSELAAGLPADAAQRALLLYELEARLLERSRASPVVVVIDDLHRADDVTLLAVRHLVPRLAGRPVCWIVSATTEERATGAYRTIATLAEHGLVTMRLEPLAPAAVTQLVGDLAGAPPDPALDRAAPRLGGLPALVKLLVDGLREEGSLTRADGRIRLTGSPLPARLSLAALARLAEVTPQGGELLRLAAHLEPRFTAAHLRLLTPHGTAALATLIADLIRSGHLVEDGDALAFRRAIEREALLAELSPQERRRIDRELAPRLLEGGIPAAEVADMVLRSAEPGDAPAVGILVDAAASLAARAPGEAAKLNLRAIELMSRHDPARGVLVAATIPLLAIAGERETAQRVAGGAVRDNLEPEVEGRIRLAMAELEAPYSHAAALAQAEAGVDLPGLPVPLRLGLMQALGTAKLWMGDVAAVDAMARRIRRVACQAGLPAAEADALGTQATVRAHEGDYTAAFAIIDQAIARRQAAAGGSDDQLRAWRALLTSAAGPIQDALDETAQGFEAARRRADAPAIALWTMVRARVLLDAGRLREAVDEAHAASLVVPPGNALDRTANYVLGRAALHTGDDAALREATARAQAMRADPALTIARMGTWLLALAADAAGDEASAATLLAEVVLALEHDGPRAAVPLNAADLPLMVRCALRRGEPELAAIATGFAETRARANAESTIHEAAAAHCRGLLERDTADLSRAAMLLAGEPRALARAAALEDLGVAAGRSAGAPVHLNRAYDEYLVAGASVDVDRVRRSLRRFGIRRDRPQQNGGGGLAALSPAEWPVVELVAAGASNREAAERLFLSPHTVSSHLRSAFTKLGVRSRVELTRLIVEGRGETEEAGR